MALGCHFLHVYYFRPGYEFDVMAVIASDHSLEYVCV